MSKLERDRDRAIASALEDLRRIGCTITCSDALRRLWDEGYRAAINLLLIEQYKQ